MRIGEVEVLQAADMWLHTVLELFLVLTLPSAAVSRWSILSFVQLFICLSVCLSLLLSDLDATTNFTADL